MIARTIRAVLLARATAATFGVRRASNWTSHGRRSSRRSARTPRRRRPASVADIGRPARWPPSRSLPPLEFCLGTRPIQAARLRPVLKTLGSAIVPTRALVSSGLTPGISIRRRPTSVDRALVRHPLAWNALVSRVVDHLDQRVQSLPANGGGHPKLRHVAANGVGDLDALPIRIDRVRRNEGRTHDIRRKCWQGDQLSPLS